MSTTNPQDVLSEWDELQIKYGNYAPRRREVTCEELSRAAVDAAEQVDLLDTQPLADLEKLEDEIPAETLDVYRARRLAELKAAAALDRYGAVVSVTETNYVAEVTDSSRSAPGQVVLLLLLSASRQTQSCCQQALYSAWEVLAERHRYVKFCRAVGSEIIKGFPEKRNPAVLVYRGGAALHTFAGSAVWGGDANISEHSIEWVLCRSGLIRNCRSKTDPRPPTAPPVYQLVPQRSNRGVLDNEDDDDEDSYDSRTHANITSTTHITDRNYSSLALEKAFRVS